MKSQSNNDLFGEADRLSDEGRHVEAIEIFLELAKSGDEHAMSRLAIIYCDGLGIKKNFDESMKWDLQAIAAGNISSMSNLALTYCQQRRFLEARHWFEQAVAAGDGDAALDLAKLLRVSKFEEDNVKLLLQTVIKSKFVTKGSIEEAKALLSEIVGQKN
jgi:TPR repeat protein